MSSPPEPTPSSADWEAFYRDYRKPGYVPGFEITSKLGGGMSGLVFRARRMSIGKDYAIKFLQVEDETVRRAVVAELESVKWFAQIDHPNLVSIEDRGEVDGIPYLVMAFAGTETLRGRMPTGRTPTAEERDELLRYFLQCCRGLAALHERSLVHFDVKPANVFLKGGVARLGDYGLSKLVTHSRGSLSMGRGTPYYMAPELLQRRGDHRSDVYSAGVLLYEILCGRVPFAGDSEWEVLKKHELQPPELPAHLGPRERAVLQRCLQKDPDARYQSVHDVLAAFGAPEDPGARGEPAAPARRRTASTATAPLRDCVVPPLPPRPPLPVPPPLPLPRRAKPAPAAPHALRRRIVTMLAAVVAALLALQWLRERHHDRPWRTRERIVEAAPRRTVPATASGRLDQLLGSIHRSVRAAAQRQARTALPELDEASFALPRDFRAYRQVVRELARAPVFADGHATKIERLGRPAFVAAVALLHELDYENARDCREGTNLHRLLGHMVAIPGLETEVRSGEPREADVCRFLALAEGWRRIAEQFARDDAPWQQLLECRGKTSGAQR